MKLPTKKECLKILKENNVPDNIIAHSKAVCKVAEKVASLLEKKGIKINKKLVIAGALLHDVERAKDRHVLRGVRLLKKLGYSEVAQVVKKHSLYKLEQKNHQPAGLEEKIVFYADKRAKGSEIVSLEKRFDALEKHYKVNLKKELKFTKKIEKELLRDEKI